ncbi:hypothetical protein GCM10023114_32850 [Mycolicibacterium sediminis]|uniref:DUF5666 domain-containing protein n=2 Tax=Mycolicibacterium sediminis TaxID=1286180 RepID=A0A7I7QZ37_9MYCO|nr:hypothetical protein MSEDJ_57590 [Mycolicibacterium sediminis]
MGSRHRRQDHGTYDRETRRMVAIYLSISCAVAFAAIVAAVLVRTAGGVTPAAAAPTISSAAAQTISQEGRLVAVTPTSLTARGADGVARTYAVTAQTNAITASGSQLGDAVGTFSVDDEVAIVGVVRDGTAVATAVAHRAVSALNGPPMETITP